MSKHQEMKDLIERKRREGWTVEMTAKSHYKFTKPNCGMVFAGGNLSDHRAIKNIEARLRQAEQNRTINHRTVAIENRKPIIQGARS